jgi:hypothetical protein
MVIAPEVEVETAGKEDESPPSDTLFLSVAVEPGTV